jgi:lactoylglutathione lyase family protein
MTMLTPRSFSHVGLSVPDLEKAVAFYTAVLGCYVVMPPTEIVENDAAIGRLCTAVFGRGWGHFWIAHLSTGDKIGIELFQFDRTRPRDGEWQYWRTGGPSHFCVQDPDIEGMVERIIAHGGKQRMPIQEFYPGEKPYRMVYCEDPFGNLVEIYTHSYELTYSAGSYS